MVSFTIQDTKPFQTVSEYVPLPVPATESSTHMYADMLFVLAKLYMTGDGLPMDPRKTFTLLQQSAERGHAKANHLLGAIYFYGCFQTKQDYIQAARFFLASAKLGDHDSMYCLACMFFHGYGVKKDLSLAHKLMVKWTNQRRFRQAVQASNFQSEDI